MGISSKNLCESSKIGLPPLIQGRLLSRPNRFVAQVELMDGRVICAHCPNSGSMLTCSEPGREVFLSQKENPRARLRYTWELIDMGVS
ncbi:MAG: DNA/RNA nuclease SfsA, partial [Desulfatiglandales bacterium]